MKILIASDIHGSKESSEKLVSLEKEFNFKKIILLGDIGYSGARNIPPLDYSPIDVYKNLEKIKDKLVIIRGNCDSRVDEYVLNKKFHDKLHKNINGINFYLTHGDLYKEEDFPLKNNDFYCYGHTHIHLIKKIDGYFVLNPGSLSLPKNNNKRTYIIIDLIKKDISLFDIEDNVIESLSF